MQSKSNEFTTSAPAIAPVMMQCGAEKPEFYAMPGQGQTLEGLRRGALYCLWRDGEISTISVRRKGKSRGRRLIVVSTLRAYLSRLREEQCPSASKERAE
jgi:hypothetical protein